MAKDLKNKIRNAWISETPDIRERVVSACENETQVPAPSPVQSVAANKQKQPFFFRRLVAVMSCLILFGVGLFVGHIIPESEPFIRAETYVYLDVNPSLELSLDEDNIVLSCTAANDDAEIILNGMKLEGVELKTALNAIVGSMYVKGYLTSDENSMLISVDTSDENNTSGFLNYITRQVNEVFVDSEMECAIIAQGVNADENLKRRAEEQGISVGKMHLLDKMIGSMDDLSDADIPELAGMSIKDLNLIYSAKPSDGNKPNDELISGEIHVSVTAEEAFNAVLDEIDKTKDDVEEYHIFILPSMQGNRKAVYAVTLKLYSDSNIYKYEVDCQTGVVTIAPTDMPPEIPQDTGDNPVENGNPQTEQITPLTGRGKTDRKNLILIM